VGRAGNDRSKSFLRHCHRAVDGRFVGEADQRTYVPTFNDRFDGGDGEDRVLFLGGDFDGQGRVVPDDVAVRYNTLLHRYELTARIWNVDQQRFAIADAATGEALRHYAFFQIAQEAADRPSVEHFVIDVRAGDDVVHADPVLIGKPNGHRSQDAASDSQHRHLGRRRRPTFGGAGNDVLDGGAGLDVIRGKRRRPA
jgi:Ca2+-binding RTX toxin-like protein